MAIFPQTDRVFYGFLCIYLQIIIYSVGCVVPKGFLHLLQ